MTTDFAALEAWLRPLDAVPLECDGVSRAIAALLTRDSIPYAMHMGSMAVDDVGKIGMHFWIDLGDGWICDWRARMWLGQDARVPHGVFQPSANAHYWSGGEMSGVLTPELFHILCLKPMSDYPRFQA